MTNERASQSPTDTLDRRLVLGLAAGAALLSGCRAGAEGTVLPDVALPPLPDLSRNGWPVPGIAAGQFRGRVSVLNVWASWCPYCRGEHDQLMRLSQDGRLALVGLVYRDKPEAASTYLRRAGNPFRAVSHDPEGRLTRALGPRGVPATYVVDRTGRVVLHVSGALDDAVVGERLRPALLRAIDAASTST